MKNFILSSSVAFATMIASAQAADLEVEREVGLIVSGVVDTWIGAQFLDRGPLSDTTVLATGGEGLLSLPLGDNISLQNDVKYEYNTQANDNLSNSAGPRYSFQFAGHGSWRDPSIGLLGVFGGVGGQNHGIVGSTEVAFVGGEFQYYMDTITLYGQGGFVDYSETNAFGAPYGLDDGYFGRGVLRWFMSDRSRFEVEASYFFTDFAASDYTTDAFSVSTRYDFTLGLPIIGETSLYIAWRGTWRSDCFRDVQSSDYDLNDHTIMLGTSYSFSGDRITVDRHGATLDTPDFNHGCGRRRSRL
jgi:hypothetical protein